MNVALTCCRTSTHFMFVLCNHIRASFPTQTKWLLLWSLAGNVLRAKWCQRCEVKSEISIRKVILTIVNTNNLTIQLCYYCNRRYNILISYISILYTNLLCNTPYKCVFWPWLLEEESPTSSSVEQSLYGTDFPLTIKI